MHPVLLSVVGVAVVFISGLLTRSAIRQGGWDWAEKMSPGVTAGKGIVPTWISLLNLLGYGLIVIGVLMWIAR